MHVGCNRWSYIRVILGATFRSFWDNGKIERLFGVLGSEFTDSCCIWGPCIPGHIRRNHG